MDSATFIQNTQLAWANAVQCDPDWPTYLRSVSENLFGGLDPDTEAEFMAADGGELIDHARRPAKMRALVSSSALAVNFFAAWRKGPLDVLASALDFDSPIQSLRFEYRPAKYPVHPRSPNLDLLLTLTNGMRVAVESKFTEPYGPSRGGFAPKYFPDGIGRWDTVGLKKAQDLAAELRGRWIHLDAPQLLKHMLGLACERSSPATLLYLWFDTGRPDAERHSRELAEFATAISGDRIAFASLTYQQLFARLADHDPTPGWTSYLRGRYLNSGDIRV